MRLFRRSSSSAPEPQVVTDSAQDDSELMAVRDALAATGAWEPAADLLEDTLDDPDRRGPVAEVLATAAVAPSPWLDAWLAERPGDPGAELVAAWSMVTRAWDVRGGGRASTVGEDTFAAFFRILDDGLPLSHRAARAAPEDPTPWVVMLWLAIGRQESRPVFEDRWSELVRRDPQNRMGCIAGLQYLSKKWYGSHEEMYEFARSATDAPWHVVLPLQAHVEHQLEEGTDPAFWRRPEVAADLDAACDWLRSGSPSHAYALHDQTVVGYCLAAAERWTDAADAFARTGGRAYQYPWYYLGDPAVAFSRAYRTAGKKG